MIEIPDTGDAITVRTDWGVIATGTVGETTDRPTDELRTGDWVAIIENPEMWDVTDALGDDEPDRHVTIDHGEPMLHDGDDWNGPGLSLAAGGHNEELVLRQPEPVYRAGVLRHYTPLMAGRVEEIDTGAVVSPEQLLEPGETLPEVSQ